MGEMSGGVVICNWED